MSLAAVQPPTTTERSRSCSPRGGGTSVLFGFPPSHNSLPNIAYGLLAMSVPDIVYESGSAFPSHL